MKREKLIRARLAKGLSQKVVAELIGVSRNTWSLWELGKEDPYPINIGELCAFFGVKEPGELDLEPRQLRTEKMDTRDSCAYCTRSFGDVFHKDGVQVDEQKDDSSKYDEAQDGTRESSAATEQQARLKLAQARAKKHWTLEQASEYVGVSKNSLNNWELGKAKPYAYNVARLCDAYGMTAEELGLQEDDGRAESQALEMMPFPSATVLHLQAFIQHDLTMHLQSLVSLPYRSYQDIHNAMARILKEYDKMNTKNHHINRRKALLRLVALPFITPGIAAALTSEETPSATAAKDILAQCTVSIGACWELMKSTEYTDLVRAFEGVSSYLPVLQRMVKDSSEHRREAASLATQCLLLKTILAHHVENLANASSYAQQALFYSEAAKDISLRLRALEGLTVVYVFGKRNKQALQTIEQAEPLLKQKSIPIPPHLQALINGMLACALVRNGKDGTAYLDQASMLLPESDTKQLVECPAYVGYSKVGLLIDAGIVYSHQGNSAKAIEALSQLIDPKTFLLKVPPDVEMSRIEAINAMTMAHLRARDKDMEKTIHFWTAGIEGAKTLKSEQRFNEAVHAYEVMEYVWPNEARITELRDLINHW